MSEHTPTTKRVRDLYRGATGWRWAEHDDEDTDLSGLRANFAAEFDRWLEAEKRKWQAEALREAANADEERADYLVDTMPDVFSGLTKERSQKREEAFELRRSANRLRDAADRIEKGKQA